MLSLKAVLHFRNADSTRDLNLRFERLFARGIFDGGQVVNIYPNSQPQVEVSPFRAVSNDGMVILATGTTQLLTLPANQTSVICCKAEYVANAQAIVSFQTPEISVYNRLPDKDSLIVFCTATSGAPTDPVVLNYDLRDEVDQVGRNVVRGTVTNISQLPATGNRLSDAYFVESGTVDINNGIWVWDGSAWQNRTNAVSVATLLAQHRANLLPNEIHMTNNQADAALGTFGSPSLANRYVTSADPRMPTQGENDALVGISQPTPVAPSSSNPYVTAAYMLAEPTDKGYVSTIAPYVALSLGDGPFFVGQAAGSASATQYFKLYHATEDREYVDSTGAAAQIVDVLKSISPVTPLDPSTETSVAQTKGFYDQAIWIQYSGTIDTPFRIKYGKGLDFNNFDRGLLLRAAPQDAQISAELLERLQEISGREFDDPMLVGESNVELAAGAGGQRRYLNAVTEADVVVAGQTFPKLREVSNIAADFPQVLGDIVQIPAGNAYTVQVLPAQINAFDPSYTEDVGVLAVIQYASASVSTVRSGHTFIDDLGKRFRILAVDTANLKLLLYTGGHAVNVNNAAGNQALVVKSNNPRKIEILRSFETAFARDTIVTDGITPIPNKFDELPPGGVFVGSYQPVGDYSLIGQSILPNQGNPNGAPLGRPMFYVKPSKSGVLPDQRIALIGNWKEDAQNFPRQVVGQFSQGAIGIEYTGRVTDLTLLIPFTPTMPYGFRVFVDGVYSDTISQFVADRNLGALPPSDAISAIRGLEQTAMQPLFFPIGLNDNDIHTIRIEITQEGSGLFPLYGMEVYHAGLKEDAGRGFVSTDFVAIDTVDTAVTPVPAVQRGARIARFLDRTNKTRQIGYSYPQAVYSTGVSMLAASSTFTDASIAQDGSPGDVLLMTDRPSTTGTMTDPTNMVLRRILSVDKGTNLVTLNASPGFNLVPPNSRIELFAKIPVNPSGTPVLGAPESLYDEEYARFNVADWTAGAGTDVASLSTTSPDSRVTVLDDATTSIAVQGCQRVQTNIEGFSEAISLVSLSSTMVVSAFCSRMDLVFVGSSGTPCTVDLTIDGLVTYSVTVPNDGLVRHTVFFDAAQQSHNVLISNPSVAGELAVGQWIFHQLESNYYDGTLISEYHVLKNAVAGNVPFYDFLPSALNQPLAVSPAGVRVFDPTKYGTRLYQGTTGTLDWTATLDFTKNPKFGYSIETDRLNATCQVQVVGSHFEFGSNAYPNAGIVQVYINGIAASAANYPNVCFGVGYNSANGQYDQYAASQTARRLIITNLPLGRYVITFVVTGTKNVLSTDYRFNLLTVAENSGSGMVMRRTNREQVPNRLHYASFKDGRNFTTLSAEQLGTLPTDGGTDNVSPYPGVLESAFCTSDNSTTPINCTVGLDAGVTVVTLNFLYVTGINPGQTEGDVEVSVDGERIPRLVAGSTATKWWSEDLVNPQRIRLWADLSGSQQTIEVVRRYGSKDESAVNTARFANFFGLYVVGSSVQVLGGLAFYTSLQSAINAAPANGYIEVLAATITENVQINKAGLKILGRGRSTQITGNVTFTAAAASCTVRDLSVQGNVIFAAGSQGNRLEGFQNVAGNVTDSGSDNLYMMLEF